MTEKPHRVNRKHAKRYVLLAAPLLAMALSIGQVGANTATQAAAHASALGPIPSLTLPPLFKGRPGPGGPPAPPADAPVRAAFYYPWFPEHWTHWQHFSPVSGPYDSSSDKVIRRQIAEMQYGKIAAGIASWWGQASLEDQRIPALLQAAHGTSFKWSLYYEPALSLAQMRSDVAYILERYAGDPSYLHVNGKPVVFVYSRAVTNCGDVDVWVANNPGVYLNLAAFGGSISTCIRWPDAFHVYSPVWRLTVAKPYSVTISPGFYSASEARPRLARQPTAFAAACRQMVRSGARWQLVTTFNEFAEGTQVESASAYVSLSGYGTYLDILHYC